MFVKKGKKDVRSKSEDKVSKPIEATKFEKAPVREVGEPQARPRDTTGEGSKPSVSKPQPSVSLLQQAEKEAVTKAHNQLCDDLIKHEKDIKQTSVRNPKLSRKMN